MKSLLLIRGLPGSGKSTLARIFASIGYKHYEADMMFTRQDVYTFEPSLLKEAHAWCLMEARHALDEGCDVVVSNTFSRQWEIQPYLDLKTTATQIIECQGQFQNIHNVPPETIERMRERWESVNMDKQDV